MSTELKNNTKVKIPNKYRHAINEIDFDGDMYWVYTNKGYMFSTTQCHTENAYNQNELLTVIRQVHECNCSKCKES